MLKGVQETDDVRDQAGIGHAGHPVAAGGRPAADLRRKGVKVGPLAYSYTIYNTAGPDTAVPPEAPWLKSMLWPAIGASGVLEMARQLRARGAEFVVVSIHLGDQYVHQPNQQQRQLARDLLESPDVDVILGDHVHVVQPLREGPG